MSKRNTLMLVGTVSLVFGGLIYVMFREDTYIANFFEFIPLDIVRFYCAHIKSEFVRFYLPDFLWALSLCCFLLLLFDPKSKGSVICSGTVFLYGVLWEILQYTEVVKGTGDVIDILMYLAAAVSAVIIRTKGKLK